MAKYPSSFVAYLSLYISLYFPQKPHSIQFPVLDIGEFIHKVSGSYLVGQCLRKSISLYQVFPAGDQCAWA